jgi:hypothetical protein
MKTITVEWKHYDKDGETCLRCDKTGKNVEKAIKETKKDFRDIKINYIETMLEAKDMKLSNSLLINNELIENILGIKSSENYCHSCTCLEGTNTNCRTIKANDRIYEEVPTEFIILAMQKVIKN